MFKVTAIGYEFSHPLGLNIYRPKETDYYLLLFFRTDAEIMIDGRYITMSPNTFFLYPKGEPHIYRKLDGLFSNDWIHFDIDFSDKLFEELQIPFLTPICLYDSLPINMLMYDLRNEFISTGVHHREIMDLKMRTLFYKLSDVYEKSLSESRNMNRYQEILQLLRYQINTYEYLHANISDISSKLNISSSYLAHLYKDYFHASIGQELISSRINYAKQLLLHPKYSIAEIAVTCGYENVEHFSRQFKKITGFTPSSYRQRSLYDK